MSPVAHGLFAWLLAMLFLKKPQDRNLVVVAGISPDLDGFHILYDMESFYATHHALGHDKIRP